MVQVALVLGVETVLLSLLLIVLVRIKGVAMVTTNRSRKKGLLWLLLILLLRKDVAMVTTNCTLKKGR